MPRVLVLTSTFPRRADDTEPRFVLDLCRHLSAQAEILVLAPHAPGIETDETLEGIAVHRFRYFFSRYQSVAYEGGILARLRQNPWRVLLLPLFLIALLHATRRLLRTWNPDVVHAHWIVPQGLIACLAVGKRKPVLCTSHGGDLHALRALPLRWLKAWTLRRCRALTVVSESMVPAVRALDSSTPVEVIPMGTDLQLRFAPPADSGLRSKTEIVFAGRLVEKKGLLVLIQAFATLRRNLPRSRLTIVGDGPQRAAIEARVDDLGLRNDVTLAGAVTHRELPRYYRRAAVAVFPFVVAADGDQEGFGLVVTEAMGCGCPVIASDLPAVRSSIEAERTGVLVAPDDPEVLERAMRRVLCDEALRGELSAAALAMARRRFDWPVIAAQYWRAIQNCLHEDPGRPV